MAREPGGLSARLHDAPLDAPLRKLSVTEVLTSPRLPDLRRVIITYDDEKEEEE